MVVEYAPHGNLREFLEKHRNMMKKSLEQHYVPERFDGNAFKPSLTYTDLINFAYQVCSKAVLLFSGLISFFFSLFHTDCPWHGVLSIAEMCSS